MTDKNIFLRMFGIALEMWTYSFPGSIENVFAVSVSGVSAIAQCHQVFKGHPLPLVLGAICGDPSWPVSGFGIGRLARLKIGRRSLAVLGVVAAEQFPVPNQAGGAIPLLGGDALAINHPLAFGVKLIQDERRVPLEITQEECGDFFHFSFLCGAAAERFLKRR